jgi:hypothetical protein
MAIKDERAPVVFRNMAEYNKYYYSAPPVEQSFEEKWVQVIDSGELGELNPAERRAAMAFVGYMAALNRLLEEIFR